jgi:hypothetical protein
MAAETSDWVIAYEGKDGSYLQNLGGVDWFHAPVPRRRHQCRAQTIGLFDGEVAQRCACGAIRGIGGMWFERNTRTRGEMWEPVRRRRWFWRL